MCLYGTHILTCNLQTHTGCSRFPVVQVTCQRPFSSVSLSVMCVICECCTQEAYGGLGCDVVSPCRAWSGIAVETETEKTRVQQSYLELVLKIHISEWSCSLSTFSHFLSLSFSAAHWSNISGLQMPAIKCIKELLKNNWMCLQCFAHLTLEFRLLILPG